MTQGRKPYLPRVERFTDCAGQLRDFELTQGPQTDGVVVSARELNPLQLPGYEFSAWSPTMGDALGALRLKIREGLSRRYLADDPDRGIVMLTHTLRGLVNHQGVSIDGRHITNDQLLDLLSAFEGWGIDIKLTDPTR